ncbi:MAG: 50S ribosomal protein L22 [Candidatus Nanoarchaeia archaeon]
MVTTKYSFQKENASTAKAYGRDLPISTKAAINICKAIRGKSLEKAENILADVLSFKRPIAFTRFTDGVGHRRGAFASGRYPKKAVREILSVLMGAKTNAANIGLSEDLVLVHVCAHKASSPLHQGRQRRREMKRTHVEVILEEASNSQSKKSSTKKTSKKAAKKKSSEPAKKEDSKQSIKEDVSKGKETKSETAQPSAKKSEALKK